MNTGKMNAADQFLGLKLDDGWRVIEKLKKSEKGSGGYHSIGYKVEREGKIAFLKAFDFSEAFVPPNDPMQALPRLISMYTHEKDLLQECGDKKLRNVVVAIGGGKTIIEGMGDIEGTAYYLIFEIAEGDVRVQMDAAKAGDIVWTTKVIHDVAKGLAQVHRQMIAHQDVKPSNVLLYKDNISKLADLGRASKKGRNALHDVFNIPGDKTYAPPELLYSFLAPDFNVRRFGCDLYMLGNLICFMYTGANITSMLFDRLDPQHHWNRWAGNYEEVLPFLEKAFGQVITDLTPRIDSHVRQEVVPILRELCTPDLSRRGAPRRIGQPDQYSLERYITRLDVISKEIQVRTRIAAAAA